MAAKPKVLCLHGFRTSGSILKFQLRDVVPFVDGIFPNGNPATGPAHDIVQKFFPDQRYYEWWDKQGDNIYVGADEALKKIAQLNEECGPFVGIVCFSQGAALGAFLTAQACKDRSSAILPSLKFAVLCSPFIPRTKDMAEVFPTAGDKLSGVDVAVVWGKTDFLKESSAQTAAAFEGSLTFTHAGDHELPNLANGKEVIKNLGDFIATPRH